MNEAAPETAAFSGFRSLKANFTAVPNQYFDRVVGHCLPCVERVVAILIRATLGWEDPDTGERRLEAELALKDFIRPELSECSARRGIAGAIEAGFILQTLEATTHAPARYALRWEDVPAQKEAITRQRKAHGLKRRPGGRVSAPGWKQRSHFDTSKSGQGYQNETSNFERSNFDTSAIYNKRNSESEKKERFKKGLPSASGQETEPDRLAALSPDEYAALERTAREKVVAELGPPICDLARRGKATRDVKAMMRALLAEGERAGQRGGG